MAQARLIRFLLILIALLPLTVAAGESLTCGSRLVSEGDTKAEVFIKCGKPAWRDNWIDQVTGRGGPLEQRVTTEHERWVYNFGPNAFLRFLLFENGRLISISTGERGYNEGQTPLVACDAGQFRIGLTQYELLQRCGAPFFKDSRDEERVLRLGQGLHQYVVKHIDEWTYNLGPNQFLRILSFENGKLVEVRSGDRGF